MSITLSANAQWCVPTTLVPYSTNMPGITHVIVGTIDRTSADLENYPYNSYVNTGMSTDLYMGSTYTISITHTIDGTICPDMNLRVWLDYNMDYSFDDVGETVISVDHHAPGTYTGSFTVPATAVAGMTRMRITAKMSNLGGHTLPTPCDFPNPDPLGYHGEDEDYTINLISTTGISIPGRDEMSLSVYPNVITDHAAVSFMSRNNATIKLCNVTGETVWTKDVTGSVTRQEIFFDENMLSGLTPGIYIVCVMSDRHDQVKRIVIL